MKAIHASSLKGKTVVASDGTEVGEVEEVEVDPGSWKVTGLQLRVFRSVHQKLQVDTPVFAGGKSLVIDPTHIDRIEHETIHVTDDLWDVGRQRWV